MRSRAGYKIMINAPLQQFLMQCLVYFQKEVAFTAIDDDGQVTVLYLVYLGDDGVLVPALPIGGWVSVYFTNSSETNVS